MSDFGDLVDDPKHRRSFEKLLFLATKRGDADLVEERLSWGINQNCTFAKGRTPLITNVKSHSPNAGTMRALLKYGADPGHLDELGLTALDYARRKLAKLQAYPPKQIKSPSLDENNQLQLSPEEQEERDQLREELGEKSASICACGGRNACEQPGRCSTIPIRSSRSSRFWKRRRIRIRPRLSRMAISILPATRQRQSHDIADR